MADWDCDESKDELIQIIENLNVRLATLLEIDRKRAQLKQQLQAWQLEQEHFNEYYIRQNVAEVEKLPLLRANSDRIISFLAETSLAKEQEYSEKLIYKVKMLIKYRGSFRSLKLHEASVLLQLERVFYQKQIQKLRMRLLRRKASWNMRLLTSFWKNIKTILKSCFASACTKATANYRLAVLPRRILNLDFRSSSERILLFSARPMLYAILFQRTIYLTMLS